MSVNGFEPPQQGENEQRRVAKIREIQRGKLNCSTSGTFTLAANAASTTVQESLCSANSHIIETPTSQTASEDRASAYFWIVPGDQQFVVNHPNRPDTDRTFRYSVIG